MENLKQPRVNWKRYSASASAAYACLLSVLAFEFPLFVPALFGNLGYEPGTNVAVVALTVEIPAP